MLTEGQKEAILGKVGEGRLPRQAFIELGLPLTDLRDFQAEKRAEIRAIRDAIRVPDAPLEEWTQEQLQQEISRMEALKAAQPDKEARADARIAEVTALLE